VKRLLIACTFFFFVASLRPQDDGKLKEYQKGSWLFHACQANIRNTDAANGGNPAEVGLVTECLNYFQGFVEGAVVSTPQFCPAISSTTTTPMIRVYLNYMQAHPKLLDEHRVVGLLFALKGKID
jgi:hypothetical protein